MRHLITDAKYSDMLTDRCNSHVNEIQYLISNFKPYSLLLSYTNTIH